MRFKSLPKSSQASTENSLVLNEAIQQLSILKEKHDGRSAMAQLSNGEEVDSQALTPLETMVSPPPARLVSCSAILCHNVPLHAGTENLNAHEHLTRTRVLQSWLSWTFDQETCVHMQAPRPVPSLEAHPFHGFMQVPSPREAPNEVKSATLGLVLNLENGRAWVGSCTAGGPAAQVLLVCFRILLPAGEHSFLSSVLSCI